MISQTTDATELNHGPFPGMEAGRKAKPEVPLVKYKVTYVENKLLPTGQERYSSQKEIHSIAIIECDEASGDYGTMRFYRDGNAVAMFPVDRVVKVLKID